MRKLFLYSTFKKAKQQQEVGKSTKKRDDECHTVKIKILCKTDSQHCH